MALDEIQQFDQRGGDTPPPGNFSFTHTDVQEAQRYFTASEQPPTVPATFQISFGGESDRIPLPAPVPDPARSMADTVRTLFTDRFHERDETRFPQTLALLQQQFGQAVRDNGMDSLLHLGKRINQELGRSGLEVIVREGGQIQVVKNMRGNGRSEIASFTVRHPHDDPRTAPVMITPLDRHTAQQLGTHLNTLYRDRDEPDSIPQRAAQAAIQQALDQAARQGGRWGVAALAAEIHERAGARFVVTSKGTSLIVSTWGRDGNAEFARFEPTRREQPSRTERQMPPIR